LKLAENCGIAGTGSGCYLNLGGGCALPARPRQKHQRDAVLAMLRWVIVGSTVCTRQPVAQSLAAFAKKQRMVAERLRSRPDTRCASTSAWNWIVEWLRRTCWRRRNCPTWRRLGARAGRCLREKPHEEPPDEQKTTAAIYRCATDRKGDSLPAPSASPIAIAANRKADVVRPRRCLTATVLGWRMGYAVRDPSPANWLPALLLDLRHHLVDLCSRRLPRSLISTP